MIFNTDREVKEFAEKFDKLSYKNSKKNKLVNPVVNIDEIQKDLKERLEKALDDGTLQKRITELGLTNHYIYSLVNASFSVHGLSYTTIFKLYALLGVKNVSIQLPDTTDLNQMLFSVDSGNVAISSSGISKR